MEKKICVKCNIEKEINEFQLQKFKKYSRYCSWCKECNKIYQKGYREKNKNKIKNQRHNFYEQNKSMILNRNKQWAKNNANKVSLSCHSCDLADFCRKEVNFVKLCGKLNDNNYYKK